MTTQPRLFDGYEVQAEYVRVPGVKKPRALRKFIPEEVEQPETGDECEVTIRFKMVRSVDMVFNNKGERTGEVADVWTLVPIEDSIKLNTYVTKAEYDGLWNQEHGAA